MKIIMLIASALFSLGTSGAMNRGDHREMMRILENYHHARMQQAGNAAQQAQRQALQEKKPAVEAKPANKKAEKSSEVD